MFCEMADLPGCSVAMTKLERFDEIRTFGKRTFESKFFETVLQFLKERIIY